MLPIPHAPDARIIQFAVRKDKESAEKHLKRLFDAKSEISLVIPEIFNAVCEVFGAKVFAPADLNK